MDNTTTLIDIKGQPNTKRKRLCIPTNKLELIPETELWPSDTMLVLAQLWNEGLSKKEIAKGLNSLSDKNYYTPAQVISKAQNVLQRLNIIKRKPDARISKPRSDKQYEQKNLKCLKCQESFISGWAGERICKNCKKSTDWDSGCDYSVRTIPSILSC